MFVFDAGRGRPSLPITDNNICSLYATNFTAKAIADLLHCSPSYVYNRLYRMGLTMRRRYASVSDPELVNRVSELQEQFPNCGAEVWQLHYRHFVVIVV